MGTLTACSEGLRAVPGRTPLGAVEVEARRRDPALAEAAAHLKHLADAGRVTQIAAEPVHYRLPAQP